MPVLSKRIVLDCFYLLIFYFEKFSTDVCRLPCVVNVNLNLSIGCKTCKHKRSVKHHIKTCYECYHMLNETQFYMDPILSLFMSPTISSGIGERETLCCGYNSSTTRLEFSLPTVARKEITVTSLSFDLP